MTDDDKLSPPFRDSDALRIIIRRLELVEEKMRRHEYDLELGRLMDEASDWFKWLGECIYEREGER